MSAQVGMLGFGQMARPVASVLAEAGFQVNVFARRPEARSEADSLGFSTVDNPAALAERVDIIIDLLTDTRASWEVLLQADGLEKGLHDGLIFVDMTTSDPEDSRPFAKYLEERGVRYLDAPITGGVIGARAGQLVFMVGGDRALYDQMSPLFSVLSKACFHLGTVGSGHLMKLIHNQLSHSTFLAACEAVLLGKRHGLDEATMIDVFNEGNARSYATEVRFPKFILSGSYNAGASFATVHKDISLVSRKVREAGLELPITAATLDYWSAPCESGRAHEDYTTILRLMDEQNGRPPTVDDSDYVP